MGLLIEPHCSPVLDFYVAASEQWNQRLYIIQSSFLLRNALQLTTSDWLANLDIQLLFTAGGLGGVVGLTLPMACAVRVPYPTCRAATLDKSLTSHCL